MRFVFVTSEGGGLEFLERRSQEPREDFIVVSDMTDKGIAYFINGEKYDGHWVDNQRHGKGIYYNSNGNIIYNGEWKNNKIYI